MKRVFIFGGCTSRDAVDFYPEFGLQLGFYVARQSIISAFRPADPKNFSIPSDLPSFQRRMFDWDIKGLLPRKIEEHCHETDLLIWDLMIERVGVAKVATGGMVTRNGVPQSSTGNLKGSYVFGTDAHMRQWTWALERFVALLDSTGLKEKTVINATPWATVDSAGNPATSESTMKPEWFNENVRNYWQAAERMGIKIAQVDAKDAIADPNHKWGPAYFHYVPHTYRAQLKKILEVVQLD